MKHSIQSILHKYQHGREVAVWDDNGAPLCGKTALTPSTHFVIVSHKGSDSVCLELETLGFERGLDYVDWKWSYTHRSSGLPVDWEYRGTPIGAWSYFGEQLLTAVAWGYIKSIGRHTSVNESARFERNHQLNMISQGHLYAVLSDANRELFSQTANRTTADSDELGNGRLIIGNDVWIGSGAFINTSKCAIIGDGAVVAAGSVVNSDVPPYAIVAGVPAVVKKYRYTPEQIETLMRVKWWEWDNKTVDANAELLISPTKFFKRYGGNTN
ncbi:MAG: CatB-related O-acetyltransferase [Oscillospiraceae bacterium]|nr:CatB-related O-acetyltransferase [Oscillospiraceae bacterium]